MYKARDLHVFVLTYQRPLFLKYTLQSICNQTLRGFSTTTLDNGSKDDTPSVAREFEPLGIHFLTTERNMGSTWNFQRAIDLAEEKLIMLMHDDDLYHPQYLENVLKVFNDHPNISVVGCNYEIIDERADYLSQRWKDLSGKISYFPTQKDFAGEIYFNRFMFPAFVYKREMLQQQNVSVLFSVYGKIFDKILVANCLNDRLGAILLEDPYIKYRLHSNQDSRSFASGPYIEQWVALERFFEQILDKNMYSQAWWSYSRDRLKSLAGGYCSLRYGYKRMSLNSWLIKAYRLGICPGWLLFLEIVFRVKKKVPFGSIP